MRESLKGRKFWGFPSGSVVKNPPVNAGATGLIPDLERSHMPRSKLAHAPQLLDLGARALELQLPKSSHTGAHPLHQGGPPK